MIKELLKDKSYKEKTKIKADEIRKIKFAKKYKKGDLEIEILEVSKEEDCLIVFARAFDNGKQIGFGKDGTVDIERFRIYNPPILVDDNQGDIKQEIETLEGKKIRTLKENPEEAVIQTLEHTIKLVGKKGNIVKGKIGKTTSTFYPDASSGGTTVDGALRADYASLTTWSNIRSTAITIFKGATTFMVTACRIMRTSTSSYGWRDFWRSFYTFDTSVIGTDEISSAILSIYGNEKKDEYTSSIVTVGANLTNANDLVLADYTRYLTTELASRFTVAGYNTSAYNDIYLNASGLSHINKTGVSQFAMLVDRDFDNNEPSTIGDTYINSYFADETGTTKDPKLVVVHEAPTTFIPQMIIT